MKNKLKDGMGFYFTAFSVPFILFAVLLAMNGISPFGSEKTICWVDANAQYISFFSYYKEVVADGASPLFSFAKLIGGDMAGFFSYYLMSPFNLLFLLFPVSKLQSAVAVVGAFKIGAAGLCSGVFFKSKGLSHTKALLLAAAYALMSYNIVYLPNIMWLDGVIALPLIAMGIDRIMEKGSPAMYIFSLFYSIAVNYYIGFMLCITSVMYWFYCFISEKISFKDKAVGTVKYALASILSGMMSMFVILPTLASLEGTSKSSLPLKEIIGLETLLSFRDLAKHIVIPQTTMQSYETMLPNVFTGFVITALCAMFVLNFRVNWRKKAAAAVIVLVFAVSFYFKTPYLIWHGLASPVCFEYRFSFAASFFMIVMAMEFLAVTKIKDTAWSAALAVNCISLLWYGNANYSVASLPKPRFEKFVNDNLPIIEQIEAGETGFYRIEKDYEYNKNDAMTLGYNGLTHYSSGEKIITRKALQKAGYTASEGYGMYGNGSTLASDGMFGIKYLLYKDTCRTGLEEISNYDDVKVYKNPYTWNIAFGADGAVTQLADSDITTGLLPQQLLNTAWNENLFPAAAAENVSVKMEKIETHRTETDALLYRPIDGEGKITYEFAMPESSNLYINIVTPTRGTVESIKCGDVEITGYPHFLDYGVRFIRTAEKGEKISVTVTLIGDLIVDEVQFIYDNFAQLDIMNELMKENSFEVVEYKTDKFTVKGTVEKADGIMLMIPFHEGWKFELNGKDVTPQKVVDNFVFVPSDKGDFTLKVSFVPPLLPQGLFISAIALAAAVTWIWRYKAKQVKDAST